MSRDAQCLGGFLETKQHISVELYDGMGGEVFVLKKIQITKKNADCGKSIGLMSNMRGNNYTISTERPVISFPLHVVT